MRQLPEAGAETSKIVVGAVISASSGFESFCAPSIPQLEFGIADSSELPVGRTPHCHCLPPGSVIDSWTDGEPLMMSALASPAATRSAWRRLEGPPFGPVNNRYPK
jgi:hypothetical protein